VAFFGRHVEAVAEFAALDAAKPAQGAEADPVAAPVSPAEKPPQSALPSVKLPTDEWMGKRLVTHAEWELAARGTEGRLFPGALAAAGNVHGDDTPLRGRGSASFEDFLANVSPVDSHPDGATPDGILNLFGNVKEWTESRFRKAHDGVDHFDPFERYVMGGAWDAIDDGQTDLSRSHDFDEIDGATTDRGFRCAKSIIP
jgi:formylglycine-generating enzyme required for sulfatase activity